MVYGRNWRRSAALVALATGLVTANGAAAQQTRLSNPDDAAAGEDVVVTGTRIKRPDLTSNSPLTSVSSQELTLQGTNNIENALNRLPQFTADANENVSNGSNGTAQINLRNLGSNRVLTLVNGQRLLPTQAMDLNFIPSAIVERVDVVTGGASAVYGSDALSGVVNFILRDKLDGFRLDAQTSIADHTNDNQFLRGIVSARGYQTAPEHVFDGAKQDINAAFGKTMLDGRLNITVFGGYRHTEPVLQSTRDVSACALNSELTTFSCGGSSNTPYGTFTPLAGPLAGQKLTNSKDGTKTWVPYDNSYTYNYAPLNYIQRSGERYNAGAFLHLDISKAAEIYGSFMYMDDRSFSQVAPSALWFGQTYAVTCNNPLMSASQQQALCGAAAGTATTQNTLVGYRLGGSGTLPRRDDLQHHYYRSMVGVRGDIGHGFNYDVSVLRSAAHYDEQYMNDVNVVKAQRALLAVPDGKGGAVCQSVLNGTDTACTPINVFQAGGLTGQQAQYLYAPTTTWGRYGLNVVSGSISGDLGTFGITSPWARDGVGIVLGGEHRRETLYFTGDEVAKQAGTQDSDGIIAVNEGFGEIEIPIVQDSAIGKSLTLNGGFRYSAYKNNQRSTGYSSRYNAFTYKGELSWQVIDPIRLRASFNHAIRAPNISELFSNLSLGNVNAQDPCAGAKPTASLSACQLTGVTAAQYNSRLVIECPSDQCTGQSGGNRNLKPETADTYTAGIVLTPGGGRNLSVSIDYFNIKVKDYIGTIDTNTIISQCFSTGSPYYCGLFHRDPVTGSIFGTGYVTSTTLNTGYLRTSGLDLAANAMVPIGNLGRLYADFIGTYLFEQATQPLPTGDSYDCKGLFGYACGQPNPVWRHNLRVTWKPDAKTSLSFNWRYIDKTKLSTTSSNSFLTGAADPIDSRLPAYSYFDLTAGVEVDRNLTLRIGANNLLDKSPPALASGVLNLFGNGNTYPGVYDVLGRRIFVGATVKF
ncbi:iron complex outermembrane receptor protein [Sphingomonas sp. SORGH_AS870]|uniref:TonB-dependent receptor domain-containing protein n=1 Tax=Sphingomonas sp. SORGH_AS_0870 TaxID=3041801 RepID=UPI00285631F1|nr:TonB-dependent receptor [Sphingomonas sp. SORGH_AS_0870]MDR6146027.1 iron complex outermembrane receptor protein [Sphingomonas sp. SORGH_AS_0870]